MASAKVATKGLVTQVVALGCRFGKEEREFHFAIVVQEGAGQKSAFFIAEEKIPEKTNDFIPLPDIFCTHPRHLGALARILLEEFDARLEVLKEQKQDI